MPDTNAAVIEAQAASATESQADTGSSSQAEGAQTAQAASAAAESGTDFAALQRELAEARKEAAKSRTELKKLSDAQKAADDADLSEVEKLKRQVDELTAERTAQVTAQREQAIHMAAVTAAARLGFADPEDAYALLDRDAIETDDAGAPRNISNLLAALLKAKPYLGAAHARPMGSADGGARSGDPTLADQIKTAETDGNWKLSRQLKMQKLAISRRDPAGMTRS